MTITQLGGEVSTWWDAAGVGDSLVLLHPGGADSRAFDSNLDGLAAAFRAYRFDRRAQGRTPDIGGLITFAQMTDDAIAFIETVVREPAHLLGHSIGAPVALMVAHKRPDLVRGLVFSEGVFHFDGWKPGVLDPLPPDVLEFLGGLYAEVSPHGAEHWPSVWSRLDAEHHRAPALTPDGHDHHTQPADIRRRERGPGRAPAHHAQRTASRPAGHRPWHGARPARRQARPLQPHDHRVPHADPVTAGSPGRGARKIALRGPDASRATKRPTFG